jgi:hypothetical protein
MRAEDTMSNWKRAAIFGSFGAAAFFLVTGKKPIGFALAGVGAAVLASEYPDQVRDLWERVPEYLERSNQLVSGVSHALERLAEYNAQRHGDREDYA